MAFWRWPGRTRPRTVRVQQTDELPSVFNVTGKLVLTGGGAGPQIRVSGSVQPKDVLYNLIGTGADVAFSGGGGGLNCCAAILDATLLAPYRKNGTCAAH